jgi:hypothetical protein
MGNREIRTVFDARIELDGIAMRLDAIGGLLSFQTDCDDRFSSTGVIIRDQAIAIRKVSEIMCHMTGGLDEKRKE